MSTCWTFKAGERPNTVVVYEREPGGPLYARAWDASAQSGKGDWRRVSLKHRDKTRAKRYAKEQSLKLEAGDAEFGNGRVTLAQVFALYEQHRTSRKAKTEQKADSRRAELWTRVLGGSSDPHAISLAQWESFIDARQAGAIDARGNAVTEGDRRPVRKRPVEADCVWLLLVFNWAAKWRLENGRYLMRENPVRGYDIPHEKNPQRPVATQDRFEAIRAVSDSHMKDVRVKGKRLRQRSYLSELLDIVNGTGRRIRAVCELRYNDLRLERTKAAPHGAIRWPADTDKKGYESIVPLSPTVRSAIDRVLRDRPGVGHVPLFPSAKDASTAISRHLADAWLREAESMAKLEPQRGSLWHAYRRKWGTERKHLPDVDVAAAGGWRSLDALKTAYQQADDATMLQVVMGGGELREAR